MCAISDVVIRLPRNSEILFMVGFGGMDGCGGVVGGGVVASSGIGGGGNEAERLG